MNIPKARWDHLLAMERSAAEREVVRLGYTIEDYNQLRKAFMAGKLNGKVEDAPKPITIEEPKKGKYIRPDKEEVKRLYQEGLTAPQISKKIGCSDQAIRNLLKSMDIYSKDEQSKKKEIVEAKPTEQVQPKTGRKPREEHQQIVDLYLKENKTVYEIINITGCSEPTVRRVLKANVSPDLYPRVKRYTDRKPEKANIEVKPEVEPQSIVEVKEIPPAPKLEEQELYIPELDYIAAKLTREELIGYVKGNVMECLFKDTLRAEILLKWLNTKGISCYE